MSIGTDKMIPYQYYKLGENYSLKEEYLLTNDKGQVYFFIKECDQATGEDGYYLCIIDETPSRAVDVMENLEIDRFALAADSELVKFMTEKPNTKDIRCQPALIDAGEEAGLFVIFGALKENLGENEPNLCFHNLNENKVTKQIKWAHAFVDFN